MVIEVDEEVDGDCEEGLERRIVEVIKGDLDVSVGSEGGEVDDSDGEWGGGIGSVGEAEAGDAVGFAGVGRETVDVARDSPAVGNAEVV